jgi:hypothetical protein
VMRMPAEKPQPAAHIDGRGHLEYEDSFETSNQTS